MAQERAQLEGKRPVGVKPSLLADKVREAEEKMQAEGRALLFKVNSFEGFLSRRAELPTGGVYQSILGAAYGPPGSLCDAPAAPPGDDIPW